MDLYKDAHLTTRTSIQELFQVCGAKGDKKRYKTRAIYGVIKECIQWFIDAEYIRLAGGKKLDSFSFDQLLKIELIEENFYPSVKFVGGKEKIDEPFIVITMDEFEAVMNISAQRRPRIMYVFAYIKSHCGFRIKDQSIAAFPKVALLTQRQISKHTGFIQAKVSNYIDQLCDADVLKRRELKRQAENQNPPHIYAANEDGWEQELYYGELKYNKQREIKGD